MIIKNIRIPIYGGKRRIKKLKTMTPKEIKSRILNLQKQIKKSPSNTPKEVAKINQMKLEVQNLKDMLDSAK